MKALNEQFESIRKAIEEYDGIIFYDINNGKSCPTTIGEILEQVKANPHCSDDPNESFWFGSDDEISLSIQDIADILGIELEEL